MTRAEREAFLAEARVGFVSFARGDGGALTVPLWYDYEPGGEVVIMMEQGSLKHRLLEKAPRFGICVQSEERPYRYASAEGPVVSTTPLEEERELRHIARRYFGEELGHAYADMSLAGLGESNSSAIAVRMRPERWASVDYRKRDLPSES